MEIAILVISFVITGALLYAYMYWSNKKWWENLNRRAEIIRNADELNGSEKQ